MKVEFDKVFEFTLDNVSFGTLPNEIIYDMFKDGRLASHFLERQLEQWFPELTFVNAKGYDHLDEDGVMFDQKCFTKGGLKFMPSTMIGAGRSLDEEVAQAHANEINYICCDIVDFPSVRVVFKRGSDLVAEYPKCSIPFKNRNFLFDNA
jgi:hypothetical protein